MKQIFKPDLEEYELSNYFSSLGYYDVIERTRKDADFNTEQTNTMGKLDNFFKKTFCQSWNWLKGKIYKETIFRTLQEWVTKYSIVIKMTMLISL
jgi:hypothetical protein